MKKHCKIRENKLKLTTLGFTLIELLGVIIILGVLTLVVFPLILKQINNAKQGIKDANDILIIDGAKDYYEDNKQDFTKIDGISYCIDISTLKENNYISSTLKNEDNEDIDTSKIVKLTYLNNLFNYKIVDECTVSLTRNGIEVPIEQEVLNAGLYASTIDEGRYIYRGANPNNYIWLDENGDGNKQDTELYRIISFESDGTVKVIRNNSIGSMSWDSRTSETTGHRKNADNSYCNYTGTYYGCNAWGNQNNTYFLGNLLQDSFYYKYYPNNITTDLVQNANGLTATTDSSLNMYLNNDWLNGTKLSDYIVSHSFNVGGIYYYSNYTGGDKGLSKEKEEQNMYTWNGKVGLMNITDMVESSVNTSCTSVYSNYYYNSSYFYDASGDGTKTQNNSTWPCTNGNWMFKGINEWSLSPRSSNRNNVWLVLASGSFNNYYAYYSHGVRPSFYLKPTIVLDGVGTEVNPYKIK